MFPRRAPDQADADRKYKDLTGQIRLVGDEPVFDGNYSKVYKGIFKNGFVAVKVLKIIPGKNAASMERKMKREMNMWAESHDYYIAVFLGHARGPKFGPLGALVSRWYDSGDSHTYLESNKYTLTFWDRIRLFSSTAHGLRFLHKKGIVHGDIKPGNVLVDDYGEPKICDFGLARLFLDAPSNGLTTTSEFTGTPRYLAPELLTSESTPPTTASDVWALGCLGLEFMFGIMPYAHRINNNRGVIYQDIKNGRLPYEKARRSGLEDAVQELIYMCWSRDHTRRPGIRDIRALTVLLQGYPMSSFKTISSLHPVTLVYEMACITRQADEKASGEMPLFVRPSSRSQLLDNDGLATLQGWRQWALFQVDGAATSGRAHWDVNELYTNRKEAFLNPETSQIVNVVSITQEYDSMRSKGGGAFPILPVGEWPVHGQGSIILPEWIEANFDYWY